MTAMAERGHSGLIFDIGSLKSPLIPALESLAAAGAQVTSLHPMFGPDAELLSDKHVLFLDVGVPAAEMGHHGFVITGRNSERAAPLVKQLEKQGLEFSLFSIPAEPTTDLALAAVERANDDAHVVMTLIGDGPDRERNSPKIAELEAKGFLVDLGWQDQEAIEAAYQSNDVLLYNSLRDNGSAPLHAASRFGMPAVVLNHHGPGFITNDQWAIRLPLSNPSQSIADLAQAMVDLAGDPNRRVEMGKAALEASHNNRWSDWAKYLDDLYRELRDN